MDNIITNPEVPTAKTIKMNDCDFLGDILSTTKAIAHMQSLAMCEASNLSLNQAIHMMYDETEQRARSIFNLMFKNGWYPIVKADPNIVHYTTDHLNQKLNELNTGGN